MESLKALIPSTAEVLRHLSPQRGGRLHMEFSYAYVLTRRPCENAGNIRRGFSFRHWSEAFFAFFEARVWVPAFAGTPAESLCEASPESTPAQFIHMHSPLGAPPAGGEGKPLNRPRTVARSPPIGYPERRCVAACERSIRGRIARPSPVPPLVLVGVVHPHERLGTPPRAFMRMPRSVVVDRHGQITVIAMAGDRIALERDAPRWKPDWQARLNAAVFHRHHGQAAKLHTVAAWPLRSASCANSSLARVMSFGARARAVRRARRRDQVLSACRTSHRILVACRDFGLSADQLQVRVFTVQDCAQVVRHAVPSPPHRGALFDRALVGFHLRNAGARGALPVPRVCVSSALRGLAEAFGGSARPARLIWLRRNNTDTIIRSTTCPPSKSEDPISRHRPRCAGRRRASRVVKLMRILPQVGAATVSI